MGRRRWLVVAIGAVVLAAGLVTASVAAFRGHGEGPGPGSVPAQGRPGGFGWFAARQVPAGWQRAALARGQGVLSYPRSLRPMAGHSGTVTAGRTSASGAVLVYLNATPRQGKESLRDWADFRLDHLREDGDTDVRLDETSAPLSFRGGHGRCVMDDYVTRIRGNHYREIACFVQGSRGASVLIAATPAADWGTYGGLLEQAVSEYAVS